MDSIKLVIYFFQNKINEEILLVDHLFKINDIFGIKNYMDNGKCIGLSFRILYETSKNFPNQIQFKNNNYQIYLHPKSSKLITLGVTFDENLKIKKLLQNYPFISIINEEILNYVKITLLIPKIIYYHMISNNNFFNINVLYIN
jgi:hypothetical protein